MEQDQVFGSVLVCVYNSLLYLLDLMLYILHPHMTSSSKGILYGMLLWEYHAKMGMFQVVC